MENIRTGADNGAAFPMAAQHGLVEELFGNYTAIEHREGLEEHAARETVEVEPDVRIKNNLTVGGVLRVKKFVHPFGCLFYYLSDLQQEIPSPEPGMWAFVGPIFPYSIYRCYESGKWELEREGSSLFIKTSQIIKSLGELEANNDENKLVSAVVVRLIYDKLKKLPQTGGGGGGGTIDEGELRRLIGIYLRELLSEGGYDKLLGLGNILIPVNREGERVDWGSADLYALRSTVGFYSDKFISAYGIGYGGGSGSGSGTGSGEGTTYYLRTLGDVLLNNPISGQSLVFDGLHWVNKAVSGGAGLDEEALGVYLRVNNYAKKSDIPDITGYATQEWVLGKSYVDTTALALALENKADQTTFDTFKALFDSMFEKEPDGKGGFRIKAKYGLYSESFLTAYGLNSGDGSGDVGGGSCAGLDEEALARYLRVNNYAKKSDIPDLGGYATREWVLGNNYVDTTALALALEKKVDQTTFDKFKALFDSMFEKEPDGKGGFRIKALLGLYSESYLTAYGIHEGGESGSGTGGGGLDEESLARYLRVNNYAKKSDIPDVEGYVMRIGFNGNLLEWEQGGTKNSVVVPYASNSDMLGGQGENRFFRDRGLVSADYIDSTDYNIVGSDKFVQLSNGAYQIQRSGSSEMLLHFNNTGSTSGLEIYTNYPNAADIFYRKIIDSNKIAGAWIKFITEANYTNILNDKYVTLDAAKQYITSIYNHSTNNAICYNKNGLEYTLRPCVSDGVYYNRIQNVDIDDISDQRFRTYEITTPKGTLPEELENQEWLKIMDWGSGDSTYRVQMATSYITDDAMYLRHKLGGEWREWRKVIDSKNYAEVLEHGLKVHKVGVTDIGDLNEPDALDSGMTINRYNRDAQNNPQAADNANWVINLFTGTYGATGRYGHQIAANNAGSIFLRKWSNGVTADWQQFVTTMNYDALIGTTYVHKNGDTMTGNLLMTNGEAKICVTDGSGSDSGYGYVSVVRNASTDNAAYFAMVRSGNAARAFGINIYDQIVIGSAATGKTVLPWLTIGPNSMACPGTFNSGGNITTQGSLNALCIELSHATPFIDFHYDYSTSDYTSRIIEEEEGRLAISNHLKINGSRLYFRDTDHYIELDAKGRFHFSHTVYTEGHLSAYGIPGGGDLSLGSMPDVDILKPKNGDILTFNGEKWVNLSWGSKGILVAIFYCDKTVSYQQTPDVMFNPFKINFEDDDTGEYMSLGNLTSLFPNVEIDGEWDTKHIEFRNVTLSGNARIDVDGASDNQCYTTGTGKAIMGIFIN